VLGQLDEARADLAELAEVRRGHVRIGATLVLGSLDLPRSLAQFRRRYPGVTVALRAGLIADLLGELGSGVIDIVLGPLHPELLPGFLAQPLTEERVVLVTPPGRPAPGPAPAALADFAGEPFVCLPAGSGLHAILVAAAAAAGFRLQPAPPHPPIGLVRVPGRTPGPATRAFQQHLEQAYPVPGR
jgi:DNA-binding transcriptional LysR family regulator